MFKTNLGSADRVIRIVAGLLILSLLVLLPGSPWRWAGLLGVPLIATGLMSSCLVYRMLGISTCPTSR